MPSMIHNSVGYAVLIRFDNVGEVSILVAIVERCTDMSINYCNKLT